MAMARDLFFLIGEALKILRQKASETKTGARAISALRWISDPVNFLLASARLHRHRVRARDALPFDAQSVIRVTFRHLASEFNNQVTREWRPRWETNYHQSKFHFFFGHKMLGNLKSFAIPVSALAINESCFAILNRRLKKAQLRDLLGAVISAMLTELDLYIAQLYDQRTVKASEQHVFDLIYDNDEGICISFSTKISHLGEQPFTHFHSDLFDVGQFEDGCYKFFRLRLSRKRLGRILDEGLLPHASDFDLVTEQNFLTILKAEMEKSILRQEIVSIVERWRGLKL